MSSFLSTAIRRAHSYIQEKPTNHPSDSEMAHTADPATSGTQDLPNLNPMAPIAEIKHPGSPALGEERQKHTKPAPPFSDSLRLVKQDLERERRRKQLAEQVVSLTKELQEERAANNTSKAVGTSMGNSQPDANTTEIKKLVEAIMAPILRDLACAQHSRMQGSHEEMRNSDQTRTQTGKRSIPKLVGRETRTQTGTRQEQTPISVPDTINTSETQTRRVAPQTYSQATKGQTAQCETTAHAEPAYNRTSQSETSTQDPEFSLPRAQRRRLNRQKTKEQKKKEEEDRQKERTRGARGSPQQLNTSLPRSSYSQAKDHPMCCKNCRTS